VHVVLVLCEWSGRGLMATHKVPTGDNGDSGEYGVQSTEYRVQDGEFFCATRENGVSLSRGPVRENTRFLRLK
jgi:hypothetical protein